MTIDANLVEGIKFGFALGSVCMAIFFLVAILIYRRFS